MKIQLLQRIFPSVEQTQKASPLSFSMMFQRYQRTSDNCALERQDLDSREANSTESFQDSWHKEVTSLKVMELVEIASMEESSRMRTSFNDICDQYDAHFFDPYSSEIIHSEIIRN